MRVQEVETFETLRLYLASKEGEARACAERARETDDLHAARLAELGERVDRIETRLVWWAAFAAGVGAVLGSGAMLFAWIQVAGAL